MRRQLATGAGLTLGTTLAFGGVAHAACTCNVDSLLDPTDPGHTTLRDAINSADANPGSTITFASNLSGTITLGSDLPAVTVATTISGPGASQLAVSGNHNYGIFDVDLSGNHGAPVTISGLTIKDGNASEGAGIYAKYPALTVSDVVITGTQNSRPGGHGAIAMERGGSLTVTRSTISNNTQTGAGAEGAGIGIGSGAHIPMTISDSTISGNSATDPGSSYGGGVYFDYSAPATLANSTVYGNSAVHGGGVYDFGAYHGGTGLNVVDSTISHNTASRGGGLAGFGASNGSTLITQPTVRDTIISGNTASTGPDVSFADWNQNPVVPGSVNAAFDLIGGLDPNTSLNQSGQNLIGADPLLGPLADNGGPTQTQKPAFNSPVVDAGNSVGLDSDQRGNGRPVEIPSIANPAGGDGADIGAVELQPSELPSNEFTATVNGKTLIVSVKSPGGVNVSDAASPLSARESKKKKKKKVNNRKGALGLNALGAKGGPPSIPVRLSLTAAAKRTLARKGRVHINARIKFTPDYGIPQTKTMTLTITAKRKGHGKHKKH